MNKLNEYLKSHDLSFADAGRALGVSSQYISRIARDQRQPSPAMTLRIEQWSGGAVPREAMRPDVYPTTDAA